jgi:hypothetical protein
MCGPGAPLGRRRRAAAGLGLESEPSARSGMTPTGGFCLAVRERKGRRDGALVRPLGRETRATQLGRLGRAGREKKKWPVGLGLAGEKGEREKKKREWAGPEEKEREKKKCI